MDPISDSVPNYMRADESVGKEHDRAGSESVGPPATTGPRTPSAQSTSHETLAVWEANKLTAPIDFRKKMLMLGCFLTDVLEIIQQVTSSCGVRMDYIVSDQQMGPTPIIDVFQLMVVCFGHPLVGYSYGSITSNYVQKYLFLHWWNENSSEEWFAIQQWFLSLAYYHIQLGGILCWEQREGCHLPEKVDTNVCRRCMMTQRILQTGRCKQYIFFYNHAPFQQVLQSYSVHSMEADPRDVIYPGWKDPSFIGSLVEAMLHHPQEFNDTHPVQFKRYE